MNKDMQGSQRRNSYEKKYFFPLLAVMAFITGLTVPIFAMTANSGTYIVLPAYDLYYYFQGKTAPFKMIADNVNQKKYYEY
ncbi:hypothetical protein [Hungatella effluvii]|uniref:hypothetical protein n=1 Tax=Hungatella effluvii TaxID=1096246 RepID=UPI000D7682EF|nr:hypothetical protein [Hungatella effluvii]